MSTITARPTEQTYLTREDWLVGRRQFVGASESAGILGVGYADQDALSIWCDKMGVPKTKDPESTRLRIGRLIEPGLRAIFEDHTGWKLWQGGDNEVRISPERPHVGCTLDGFVLADDDELNPVELKVVSWHERDDWADGNSPLKFQIQAMHQLYVTGARRGYLMGVVGMDSVELRTIDRNEHFLAALLPRLDDFWGHVLRQEPPPVGHTFASSEALKRLYPRDTGEEIDLPIEAREWQEQLAHAKGVRKTAEDEILRLENTIKEHIKTAAVGNLPGGGKFTYRTQERKGFVVEPTSFRVLRYSAK